MTATSDLMATVRAYLESADRELSDEQQAEESRKRAVFGSSDIAHQMNREGL